MVRFSYLREFKETLLSQFFKFYVLITWKFYNIIARSLTDSNVVISLTSYPPRYDNLHLTLYSLLSQSRRPNKIILNISKGQEIKLPEKVKALINRNLIYLVIVDELGPGKKIIPSLISHPESIIVTADDDIYYPRTWLKELYYGWSGNNKNAAAHRIHLISIEKEESIGRYIDWDKESKSAEISKINFGTSGGGMLFPPKVLCELAIKTEEYKKYAFFQDDIWLYWMIRMNNGVTEPTKYSYKLITWNGSQKQALVHKNVFGNKNDECVKNLIEAYGNPLKF